MHFLATSPLQEIVGGICIVLFVLCFPLLIIGMIIVGIAKAKAKSGGIDSKQIDKIISDARRRAYERGRAGT